MSDGISDSRRMSAEPFEKEALRELHRLKSWHFDMGKAIKELEKKIEEYENSNRKKEGSS